LSSTHESNGLCGSALGINRQDAKIAKDYVWLLPFSALLASWRFTAGSLFHALSNKRPYCYPCLLDIVKVLK